MPVLHAKQALLPNTWQSDVEVHVAPDGRISSVGPIAQAADTTVDVLLPAPVNLHSHTFQRAMAGLTEGRGPDPTDSFWTWRRLMYRFLDQLTPDQVEAIAAQAFMEMLEAGYGAVAEFHYLHHDVGGAPFANLAEMSERIVAAAERCGIGLSLLPVLYAFGGCDRRALVGGQRRFGNALDPFLRLHADAGRAIRKSHADYGLGVAPHSLRAVDPDGLAEVIKASGPGPVHIHVAEQVAEVDEVEAHLGARPVEWLLEAQDVDARWCLIHCTQMTDAETGRLAQTGAVAGLCPITESSLGDGIFPGTRFAEAGGTFGFGTDSNIQVSLFEELKTLEYSQRLRDRSRAVLATQDRSTGRVLFDAAARGGAQAGGRDGGTIAPGAWADLVALAGDNPWLCNRTGDTLLDTAIFGGGGQASIRDVWSAGRHVVKNGQHIHRVDITARFMRAIRALEENL